MGTEEYMLLNILFRMEKENTEYLFATVRTNWKTKREEALVSLLRRVQQHTSVEAFIFAFDSITDSSRCIEHIAMHKGSITVVHLNRANTCENLYLKFILTGVLQGYFLPIKAENPALNLLYEKFAERSTGEKINAGERKADCLSEGLIKETLAE